MSMDFSTVFAGPQRDLTDTLLDLELHLGDMGFRLAPPICRAELDAQRGVFDEVEENLGSVVSLAVARDEVADWTGMAMEFHSLEFKVYVLLAKSSSQFINCFVDVSLRVLEDLYAGHDIERLYRVLETVAADCQASFGFSTVELAFAPASPEQASLAIFDNPENPGYPCDLGFIAMNQMSETEVHKRANGLFEVRSGTKGFWILEEKDYLEFWRAKAK